MLYAKNIKHTQVNESEGCFQESRPNLLNQTGLAKKKNSIFREITSKNIYYLGILLLKPNKHKRNWAKSQTKIFEGGKQPR